MNTRGQKTVRQEKTHYKMYKSKHGWLVAGITMLTISGVGLTAGNEVHAATGDQAEPVTSQAKNAVVAKDTATKTEQSTATVNASSTDEPSAANANAVGTQSVSQETSKLVTEKKESTTSESTDTDSDKTATADSIQQTTTDTPNLSVDDAINQAANQSESVSDKPGSNQTDADKTQTTEANTVARVTRVSALPAGGETAQSEPQSSNAKVTVSFDDGQTSTKDEYRDNQITNGTPDVHVLHVTVGNLQKNDVLSFKLPQFKMVSSAPNIDGMTKSLNYNARTLDYTVTSSGAIQAEFDLRLASADMAAGEYSDSLQVSVNGVEKATAAMSAKYTLSVVDNKPLVGIYAYADASVDKIVQVGATFVSSVRVTGSTANFPKLPADWSSLKVTVPVPANYVLNQDLTAQYNKLLLTVPNAWTITQAAPGADIEITANLGAYKDNKEIQNDIYLVGVITAGTPGNVSASQSTSMAAQNVLGNFDVTDKPFKVSLASSTNRIAESQIGGSLVYVGPTDVGVLDVNKSQLYLANTGNTIGDFEVNVEVPQGTHSDGLVVVMPHYGTLTNQTAKVVALDANGKVLDQTELQGGVPGSSNQTTWIPKTTEDIASYKIDFLNYMNSSLGKIGVWPRLTVDAVPTAPTTIVIPVSHTVDGVTTNLVNYTIRVTGSHTIYSTADPRIDAYQNTRVAFQPGDPLYESNKQMTDTYKILLFNNGVNVSTYPIFDGTTTVYVPLPNDTTLVGVGKYKNVTQISEHGLNYARIVLPAGTNAQSSSNQYYNGTPAFNQIPVTVRLNSDVTAADTIAIPDWKVAPVFMGVTDNQVDESSWKGQIWTIAQIKAAGFTVIAQQLEAAGYTQAYLNTTNAGAATLQFPLTVPTSFVTDQAIKGDTDTSYVSGDGSDGTANFYPEAGALTGTIRDYVGNGTNSAVTDYTSLITLPNKNAGDAYSLNLTGPITVPEGLTVTYSTNKVVGIDGNKLTTDQLSSFVTGDQISDWASVQSVLVTAPTLAAGALKQVIIPVTVAAYGSDAATASGTSFTYVDGANGIVGGTNVLLPTRIAEAQRQVTVRYVDADGNALSLPTELKADAGSTLNLAAVLVTGYAPRTETQSYVVTDDALQNVDFVYDKTDMKVAVRFINQVSGLPIKSTTATGKIGETLDLTGDTYTKLAGYTANTKNATAYTVTTAQAQVVNLYFMPESTELTVQYMSKKGTSLLPDKTIPNVLLGSTYDVVAPTITGYTPDKATQSVTVSGEHPVVKITYTPEVRDYIVNYVDQDGKSIHTSDQLTLNYDSNQTITAIDIDGYQLTSGEAATHEVNFAADNGTYTFTYVAGKAITRTIEYVNVAGEEVAPSVQQTVTVTQHNTGDWSTGEYGPVQSPVVHGLAADPANVGAATVTADSQNSTVKVVYRPVAVDAGVHDSSKTFTRTIEYVNVAGQEVAPSVQQTATVTQHNDGDWSTGEYGPVQSPVVHGLAADPANVGAATVTADSQNSTVKVVYRPVAVDAGVHDSSKTFTRTIEYVNVAGEEVAPSVQQTVTVTQHNTGDWSTGEYGPVQSPVVHGLAADPANVGAATVTADSHNSTVKVVYRPVAVDAGVHDSSKTFTRTIEYVNVAGEKVAPSVQQTATVTQHNDGDWSTDEYEPVKSPVVHGLAADPANVGAATVTADSHNSTVKVVYRPVAVGTGIHDSAKTLTRTIKYVDVAGKQVAPTVQQTATISQRNGEDWTTANFAAVATPSVRGLVAQQKTVASAAVTINSHNSTVTITYYAPQVGAGVHDFSKAVTRTINFVDAQGNKLAGSIVQRVNLKRTDVGSQQGTWSTGVWAAVATPQIDDYTASTNNVSAQLVAGTDSDVTVDVLYTRNGGAVVTPVTPGNGGSDQTSTGTPTTPDNGGSDQTDTGTPTTSDGKGTEQVPDTDGETNVPGQHESQTSVDTGAGQGQTTQLPSTDGGEKLTSREDSHSITMQNADAKSVREQQESIPATKAATELPQTGDTDNSKLSILGLLGLALSGITALAFKTKRKED